MRIGLRSKASTPTRVSSFRRPSRPVDSRVLRVRIIAVGKAKDRDLRSLLGDYYARIGRYAKLEELELKDGKADEVAERFARSIPDRSRVVALEVDGRALGSRDFAKVVGPSRERVGPNGRLPDRRRLRPAAGTLEEGRPPPLAVRDDPPAPPGPPLPGRADLPGLLHPPRRALRPLKGRSSPAAAGPICLHARSRPLASSRCSLPISALLVTSRRRG